MNSKRTKKMMMTRREIEDNYGISLRTLERLSANGEGPPETRIGKRVYYERLELQHWIKQHKSHSVAPEALTMSEPEELLDNIRNIVREELLGVLKRRG